MLASTTGFTIGSGGVLSIAQPFDYSVLAPYNYQVTLTIYGYYLDPTDGVQIQSNANIVISVLYVKKPPVVPSNQVFKISELASVGRVVGKISATDPDPTDTLKFTTSNLDSAFTLSADGNITLAIPLQFEVKSTYSFDVVVSNSKLSTTKGIEILVNRENKAPVYQFNEISRIVNVTENNVNAVVCESIAVKDPDSGDSVFFQFVNADIEITSIFEISSTTGRITLKVPLDYEISGSYTFNIVAIDNGGLAAKLASDSTIDTNSNLPSKNVARLKGITIVVNVVNVNDISITGVTGSPFPTAGGGVLSIVGTNLGQTYGAIRPPITVALGSAPMYNAEVFSVPVPCVQPKLYDNTALNCAIPPGSPSGALNIFIQVGGDSLLISSNSLSVQFMSPQISDVYVLADGEKQGLMKTSGGDLLVIEGSNLGLVGSDFNNFASNWVRYGPTASQFYGQRCFIKKAHIEINCYSSQGFDVGFNWQIGINSVMSNILSVPTTGYLPPFVNSVVLIDNRPLNNDSMPITSLPTLGEFPSETVFLKISGANFGVDDLKIPKVYFTSASAPNVQFEADLCSVSVPHIEIRCAKVSAGCGSNLLFTVQIGSQRNSLQTSLAFEKPYLSEVYGPGAIDALTDGLQLIRVSGGNFGPSDFCLMSLRYGADSGTALLAQGCSVTTDTTAQCLYSSPGSGKINYWSLLLGGQVSSLFNSTRTSFSAPNIISYRRLVEGQDSSVQMMNTQGSEVIAIVGRNLGPLGASVDALMVSMIVILMYNMYMRILSDLMCFVLFSAGTSVRTPLRSLWLLRLLCTF